MTDPRRRKVIREDVARRDGLYCCFCKKELSFRTMTLEHIVPVSKYGSFNRTNLTVSCARCNRRRGNENFFEYLEKFDAPNDVISKYKKLYCINLTVKVLNIAKENCIKQKIEVPIDLINQACDILNIEGIDLSGLESYFQIALDAPQPRKKIKFHFENVIKIIEKII